MIKRDNSIAEEQEFYIMEDGTTKTKSEILSLTEFNLTSFLLGIWHYAISVNNTQGKYIADILCPSTKGGKRGYQGNLGNDDKRIISVIYNPLSDVSKNIAEEPKVEVIDDVSKDAKSNEEQEPQVVNQNMNSPFIFNFNQYGNNTTQIGHIENYYADKEKKQNE